MEHTQDVDYMQAFIEAYDFGLNPAFFDIEDMLAVAPDMNSAGHIHGFLQGRQQYELLNGTVRNGIPKIILTEKLLDQFMVDGIVGMNFEASDYTSHQLQHISKYYEAGKSRCDYKCGFILEHSLSQLGIGVS